jgi:Lysine methyltransferase
LELGSGTGAVGLFASHFLQAQHVILTDLPANLPLIAKNATKNNIANNNAKIHIMPLDWTDYDTLPDYIQDYPTHIDVIVGSDLFLPYATHLLSPLARLLAKLLRLQHEKLSSSSTTTTTTTTTTSQQLPQPPCCTALICYEERFDPEAFFQECQRLQLRVVRVSDDDINVLHEKYRDPGRIHLLRITLLVNE